MVLEAVANDFSSREIRFDERYFFRSLPPIIIPQRYPHTTHPYPTPANLYVRYFFSPFLIPVISLNHYLCRTYILRCHVYVCRREKSNFAQCYFCILYIKLYMSMHDYIFFKYVTQFVEKCGFGILRSYYISVRIVLMNYDYADFSIFAFLRINAYIVLLNYISL